MLPPLTPTEMALAIAGPICLLCLLFMAAYIYYGKRRDKDKLKDFRGEDPMDAPDHPILGASCLRDMIEMTTSGSGSGKGKYAFHVEDLPRPLLIIARVFSAKERLLYFSDNGMRS